ncbi:MAG TPA: hypothetical protein ENG21_00715 [Nitrososphaeria archaeon]|nr:hypothetical protein [Nitrososphaeria archaeon]
MPQNELLSKFIGSMLAAALGDSMGAAFYKRSRDGMLRYTDDTAMMIALAESMIENKGAIDPIKLAWKFVEIYEKEPWRGYGPGPPRIFRLIRRGEGPLELDKRFYPGGSYGNGAAMRVAPVGLFFHDDIEKLKVAVEASCKPTHSNLLGIEGAFIEALSVAEALKIRRDEEADPKDFIEKLIPLASTDIYRRKLMKIPELVQDGDLSKAVRELGNGVEAFNSVPTAIYCYLRGGEPLKAIELAIRLGGDRDTIACMAGAIAGAHRGSESLPHDLLKRLENREYIMQLAKKLYELKFGGEPQR